MPRRTFYRVRAAALTGAAIAGLLAGVTVLTARTPPTADAVPAGAELGTPARDGWRWESYHHVQLQVPDSWSQKLGSKADCPEHDYEPRPVVIRPGAYGPLILRPCRKPAAPVRQVAPSVFFDGDLPGLIRYAGGWVRETRRYGSQLVTVTTDDDALRRDIFTTAELVKAVDGHGCDPRTALAEQQIVRPVAQGGLASVGAVRAVSVCRYSMAGVPIPPAGRTGDPSMRAPLKASTRLIGSEAERLVRNLLAAAVGVGPTTGDPTCSSHPGNDVVVLRVDGSHHDQDVVYRYDGCRHNGTDDGSILRKATPQTAQQIFVGVHQPNSAGYALYELLHGPVPPSLQPK